MYKLHAGIDSRLKPVRLRQSIRELKRRMFGAFHRMQCSQERYSNTNCYKNSWNVDKRGLRNYKPAWWQHWQQFMENFL